VKVADSWVVGSKRGWLWGLLIAGVLVLAAMAWHLFRQLKRDAPEPPLV